MPIRLFVSSISQVHVLTHDGDRSDQNIGDDKDGVFQKHAIDDETGG